MWRKERGSWATEQKADSISVQRLNQLGKTWENYFLGVLGNRDENPYVGKNLMGSPFVRLGGKLLFAWCLIMVISEEGKNKNLKIYDLVQHLAHNYSGLIIAGRKKSTCFLSWITSVIPDAVRFACHQNATSYPGTESRVSSSNRFHSRLSKPNSL